MERRAKHVMNGGIYIFIAKDPHWYAPGPTKTRIRVQRSTMIPGAGLLS